MHLKHFFVLTTVVSSLILGGCTSVPPDAGEHPDDPWEKVNRQTYAFNDTMDTYIMRPVAKGYMAVTPKPIQDGVGNFLTNLGEPANVINNTLQGKFERGLKSVFRFMINTALGVGGVFDVAGNYGKVAVCREDFGQTLRVWGVPQGPYLVLPFLGPSTVTDTAGFAGDVMTSPVTYADSWAVSVPYVAVKGVHTRASVMPMTDMLADAVDPYVMARQGYLANRRNATFDGNPPMELTKDEFEDDEKDAAASEAKK